MSVRASLEADTMALARFNRDRVLPGVHAGQAQSLLDVPQGAEGSKFCDSLKAHLGSEDSRDSQLEADGYATENASSSSISIALKNAADGRGANPVLEATTGAGNDATSFETALKHLARSRHAKFVPSTAVQRQSLRAAGSSAAVATCVKKSVSDESASGNALEVGSTQDAMAMVPPMGAAMATDSNRPTGSLGIAIPDSVQNNATVAEISGDGSGSSDYSSSWVNVKSKHVQGETPKRLPAANAGVYSVARQIVDVAESPEVNDVHRTQPADDHAALVQARTLAASGLDAGAGSQMDEDGAQDSASKEVIPAARMKNEDHPNVDRIYRGSESQGFAIASQPEANSTHNKLPSPDKSIDADSGALPAPLNSAVAEVSRNAGQSADSKASFPSANVDRLVRRTGNSKSSSSRSDQSNVYSADLKHALADSSAVLAPRSQEISRVAEVTNSGSIHQKTIDAISSDRRLQNTFSALEPGAQNDSSAFSRTGAGRMQAEAGYQDPALGWIGIRAEASGGAIHATLISQSSDAAQVLGGHVAGLHSYLAENHTPVEKLSLASFGGNTQQFAGHHSGQEAQQDTGQNANQRHTPEAVPEPQLITRTGVVSAARNASPSEGFFTPNQGSISSGGVHISVLA